MRWDYIKLLVKKKNWPSMDNLKDKIIKKSKKFFGFLRLPFVFTP
jgi:hypothetical protein